MHSWSMLTDRPPAWDGSMLDALRTNSIQTSAASLCGTQVVTIRCSSSVRLSGCADWAGRRDWLRELPCYLSAAMDVI
jgi:hypothetical protein